MIEWNAPLFVNFVDFRKAFDSIHRDTIWAIMRHYSLPQKIVTIIKLFYERFECGQILREGVSDFFEFQIGMHARSSLPSLILIDCVMSIDNEVSRGGIQRVVSSCPVEYLNNLTTPIIWLSCCAPEKINFPPKIFIYSPEQTHVF